MPLLSELATPSASPRSPRHLRRGGRLAPSLTAALTAVGALLASTRALAGNPIEDENQKKVDPAVDDWRAGTANVAMNGPIDAYVSDWSVKNGDKLGIRVSTVDKTFRTRIYRIGWYPNGPRGPVGSRLVHDVVSTPGERQPFPPENLETGLAECKWKNSLELTIPADWTTGLYFVRITGDSERQTYTYFIVRDDAREQKAPLLYADTLFTQQAYNAWPRLAELGKRTGGKSLYPGASGERGGGSSAGKPVKASGGDNAVEVSFDRPIADEEWDLVDYTIPAVQWLERRGYDVAYANSIDVHIGKVLEGRKAWMDSGHEEYVTLEMWDNLEKARDRGTNLAFFSGNDFLWQVRLKPGAGGPYSTLVGYKDAAYPERVICGTCADWGGDPEFRDALDAKRAHNIEEQVRHLKRVTFRWKSLTDYDPESGERIAPPQPITRDTMTLLGLRDFPINTPNCDRLSSIEDECHGVSYIVSGANHWIYTGAGVPGGVTTRLQENDLLPHMVGFEMDSAYVTKSLPTRPNGQVTLAFNDEGRYAGSWNAQYYRAASGAHVFTAGTIKWVHGLPLDPLADRAPYNVLRRRNSTGRTVYQTVNSITSNILNMMTGTAPSSGLSAGDPATDAGVDDGSIVPGGTPDAGPGDLGARGGGGCEVGNATGDVAMGTLGSLTSAAVAMAAALRRRRLRDAGS